MHLLQQANFFFVKRPAFFLRLFLKKKTSAETYFFFAKFLNCFSRWWVVKLSPDFLVYEEGEGPGDALPGWSAKIARPQTAFRGPSRWRAWSGRWSRPGRGLPAGGGGGRRRAGSAAARSADPWPLCTERKQNTVSNR